MEAILLQNQTLYDQKTLAQVCDIQYALLSLRERAEKDIVVAACSRHLGHEISESDLDKCTLVAKIKLPHERKELFYEDISLGIIITNYYKRGDQWALEVKLIMK